MTRASIQAAMLLRAADLIRPKRAASVDSADTLGRLRCLGREGARGFIPAADAVAAVEAIMAPLRAELAAMCAEIAEATLRRRLEERLQSVLAKASGRFGAAAEALRRGEDPLTNPLVGPTQEI